MRQLTPSTRLHDDMAEAFGPIADLPDHIVLAVSGGGDSMALLRMYRDWSDRQGKRCTAVTVDHGLRAESADEAALVAQWCDEIGVPHETLTWDRDDQGNLSNAAREGRYRLMADFCKAQGVDRLYTGHTKDDQAETVLMRLARGSGVDGLAAMARETQIWGLTVVRPLLDLTRDALRDHLEEFGQEWIDDPTNDEASYDRVKARQILRHLTPLGVSATRLAHTARLMGYARDVLQADADALAAQAVDFRSMGFATIEVDAIVDAPRETALRVLASTVNAIADKTYRPVLTQIEGTLDWAAERPKSGGRSFHGCIIRPKEGRFLVLREPNACVFSAQATAEPTPWDGRFHVLARGLDPADEPLTVAALGEDGLSQTTVKRDGFAEGWLSAPREARLTTPGLWRGETLLCAPLAPWTADPDGPRLIARTVWPASC